MSSGASPRSRPGRAAARTCGSCAGRSRVTSTGAFPSARSRGEPAEAGADDDDLRRGLGGARCRLPSRGRRPRFARFPPVPTAGRRSGARAGWAVERARGRRGRPRRGRPRDAATNSARAGRLLRRARGLDDAGPHRSDTPDRTHGRDHLLAQHHLAPEDLEVAHRVVEEAGHRCPLNTCTPMSSTPVSRCRSRSRPSGTVGFACLFERDQDAPDRRGAALDERGRHDEHRLRGALDHVGRDVPDRVPAHRGGPRTDHDEEHIGLRRRREQRGLGRVREDAQRHTGPRRSKAGVGLPSPSACRLRPGRRAPRHPPRHRAPGRRRRCRRAPREPVRTAWVLRSRSWTSTGDGAKSRPHIQYPIGRPAPELVRPRRRRRGRDRAVSGIAAGARRP